jgi:Sulfotransferase family
MRAFLASHPNIAIPEVGSNMWTYFYGQFGDLRRVENYERCLQAMLSYSHVRVLEPDAERISREFWQGPRNYARLFSLFLIHYAEREGKPRWGAQTGLIERYADRLFEAYPGIKIIHMIRDPRDRYEASLQLWPDGRGRAGGATARWTYSLRLAERNARKYPDDYKVVRFEDLVVHTEGTLREVCSFLDETFRPEMLAMAGAPERREKLTAGRDRNSNGEVLSRQFIGRFKDNVPPREIAFMQLQARRLMRQYGYPFQSVDLSLREWLSFATLDWPNQMVRMVAWRAVEALQQRFPTQVRRKPDPRTIVAATGGVSDDR